MTHTISVRPSRDANNIKIRTDNEDFASYSIEPSQIVPARIICHDKDSPSFEELIYSITAKSESALGLHRAQRAELKAEHTTLHEKYAAKVHMLTDAFTRLLASNLEAYADKLEDIQSEYINRLKAVS